MNKKIVIASVLKPVDDVRAYWKIAQSVAKTNKYDVNIIGNEGKKAKDHKKIRFISHQVLRSQFLKRVRIYFNILSKIYDLKPAILIISTHELLGVAFLSKLVLKCKVIYDVQENYLLNASLHGPLGKVIGYCIRLKEIILSRWIDEFWLAERCYQKELKFIHQGVMVQNKAIDYPIQTKSNEGIRAIFSGTLSDYSGVKAALQIMKMLNEKFANFEGIIIGQVHDLTLEKWLLQEVERWENIVLITSKYPVSYEKILDKIQWANLGIIAYQANKVNESKVPTKLYEYSRYQIPYLVQKNTLWAKVGDQLGGAIPFNFQQLDLDSILQKWKNQQDLFPSPYPQDATWEVESKKIITSIESLINQLQ